MVDSLKKRYIAKLIANILGLLIAVVISALVPRALGPKNYGDFEYLTNFFTQALPLVTFSTILAFYTKLSQRPREFGITSYYGRIVVFGFVLILIFIILAEFSGISSEIWPSQVSINVLYAAIFAMITFVLSSLLKMSDAFGLTKNVEYAKVGQKIIAVCIIFVMYAYEKITITSYYFFNYFILIGLITYILVLFDRSNHSLFRSWSMSGENKKRYFKEYYTYSQPLLTYTLIGFVFGVFERWLLQRYGGSIEQGYFGLANKVGALCFIFTAAMTSLIMREMAISYYDNNYNRMKYLFRRYVPLLYSVSAFLASFIFINAADVVLMVAGEQFQEAAIPMMIMSLYPIHQTYGQMSGSVFYSTGKTTLYRNIGIVFMILGAGLSYLCIAPAEYYGLGLGANGLAGKFIIIQILVVNVQLIYISKMLDLQLHRYIMHQIIVVAVLIMIAYASKMIVQHLLTNALEVYSQLILSGIIYMILVGIMLIIEPLLFGLYRKDLKRVSRLFQNIISKKN